MQAALRWSTRCGVAVALAALLFAGSGAAALANPPQDGHELDSSEVSDITTLILLRHAEKKGHSGNTPLGKEGFSRAKNLAYVAGIAGVQVLIAVTYEGDDLRVRQTLEPLAESLDIKPDIHFIKSPWDFRVLRHNIRKNHAGKVILIVSHSGSVQEIIKTFKGDPSGCNITPADYDSICVMTLVPGGAKPTILRLRYGRVSDCEPCK